ncbi:Nif3-like dinuclear metal center hexameric protein [Larsenimonas salina]|uniref:Nif3-like dinuclear metal center hexameric protein n=1 Tax=Larsenimonas salina TaxID=1295565 RepID=UPI002072CC98|nr:Nif3-like dinuclear metal center hexameric protein [Larsenimonas salina]MCM5703125.1 Nif3-like dinuclear metal center hexameric protein [Larsenimonas salina]
MIDRNTLIHMLDDELTPSRFKDYTVNGLQVEGRERIGRIMGGVTACEALIDEAIAWQADAVLVHHGYFWKNEPAQVTGMKRRRLAKLLAHDINVLAYHLPLDAHPSLGNNAQLGQLMGWTFTGVLDGPVGQGLLYEGTLSTPMTHDALTQHMGEVLERRPLMIQGHDRPIERIAWCTGGAQDMIEAARAAGVDAFVSGEISERTTHIAREEGISYFSAGHHATERCGVQALGDWLSERADIEFRFVDIDNPV